MYDDFYKFKSRPFQLTPDLKFLFPSKGHKRAMSYLHYGLEQAEGFVVITGHIGTGKTMLIQTLLAELKDQQIATARVAAANLDEHSVVPMIAAALKQPHEGKSKVALLRDMERSLRRAKDYLNGVLIIIDEAQTLTIPALEELRILSNLECKGAALMQIFLVGQSELRDTLRAPQMEHLRQRTVASYHLEPLSLEETKHYIGYRLVAVGWDGDPAFAPDFYAAVHHQTGGIPRKINILMERMLVYGFLEELHEFSGSDVECVVGEMSEEIAGDLARPFAETSGGASLLADQAAGDATTGMHPAPRRELESRLASLEAKLQRLAGDRK